MIFKAKEVTIKDGRKIILKSPEVSDAKMLLENIISVASQTNNLLSEPEDFESYLKDISKEENFIKSFHDNRNWLICVYLDGVIIGNCAINFKSHKKDCHRATVGIAIQKTYWNLGIGSILFDEMIAIARNTEGLEQLELDVVASNLSAKHLYSKKGFVKTGDIPHQLKLADGSYLDGETMVLFLNK